MFSGIITDFGFVKSATKSEGADKRYEFCTNYETKSIAIGTSIACSGVCLTVIDKGSNWFGAIVSLETLKCTTLSTWTESTPVNFEKSLKLGDEIGGHIVSGHVDAVGKILHIQKVGDSYSFSFQFPKEIAYLIAKKGSIAIDGISLTVNNVNSDSLTVNIIPHTMSVTTLGTKKVGDIVNLEVDMLARYVSRIVEER